MRCIGEMCIYIAVAFTDARIHELLSVLNEIIKMPIR